MKIIIAIYRNDIDEDSNNCIYAVRCRFNNREELENVLGSVAGRKELREDLISEH